MEKSEVKGIIFDLFGTLTSGHCDPELEIQKFYNLQNLSYSTIQSYVCGSKINNWDEYLENILNGLSLPVTAEAKSELEKIFEQDLEKEIVLPEVEDLLKDLSQKYRLAIISNIPNPKYDLLEKHNLKKYFKKVVYSYEEGINKPDKSMFEMAMKGLEIEDPTQILMVGDSLNSDIIPAKEMRMKTLLVRSFLNSKPHSILLKKEGK